jgi:sporulation protein YlmC with PRC-barrel domain
VDVVRDVLDKSVIDRNGREMGRVDGILLHQEAGQPAHLTAILIGPSVLADRLHSRLGRMIRALERRFGVDRDRPTRIDFSEIDGIDRKVRVRLTISDTAVGAIEQRLRSWVRWLPGSQ